MISIILHNKKHWTYSDDDFSNAEIVIYNQLGIVVNRISEVKKINSIVLKDGFYNGTVFWNGVKTLNFKIIAEWARWFAFLEKKS